jgi:hypothetical protein
VATHPFKKLAKVLLIYIEAKNKRSQMLGVADFRVLRVQRGRDASKIYTAPLPAPQRREVGPRGSGAATIERSDAGIYGTFGAAKGWLIPP